MDAVALVIGAVGLALVVLVLLAVLAALARRSPSRSSGPGGDLRTEKALIDQQLRQVSQRLGDFERTVREIDGRQRQQFGALATSVRSLSQTAQQLRDALGSAKQRGQWGERMADDVLRAAGFVEGVNYNKQRAVPSGGIPDFTFLLPGDLVLHMDVKFPLDNYVRFLDAESDAERSTLRRAFLRDVRDRIKELDGRGYLDDRRSTVDCLLLFVPNDNVYAFVQEHAPRLLDDAMAHNIVVCSPLTLFAILRVVRQAVDHFRLERTANEILELLGEFEVQWGKLGDRLDKLQRSFGVAQRDLEEVMGTRSRQLQRPLDRIAALRDAREPISLVEPEVAEARSLRAAP
jgi:DNA recombination protein RmuC